MIIEWLSPTNYSSQLHDIITQRQEGTGQWLLDSPKLKRWIKGSERILFCPGIPGAGKTMIAAIAINHLYSTTTGNIGIAYLFCNYKAQISQSASSLLAALLKQLVQNRPEIATPVTQMYELHSKQGSRPPSSEILQALDSVCSSYTTIYIVVDALDECSDGDGARRELISKLRELQVKRGVQLLCTSRFISEVTQEFQSDPTLEVRANEEDVRRFVLGQMSRLPKYNELLQRIIQDKITEAVDGM